MKKNLFLLIILATVGCSTRHYEPHACEKNCRFISRKCTLVNPCPTDFYREGVQYTSTYEYDDFTMDRIVHKNDIISASKCFKKTPKSAEEIPCSDKITQ